jgi:hyperosmotically inducible periplasmic protein
MPRASRSAPTTLLALILAVVLVSACAPKHANRAFDDATISTRVRTALLNDPQVGALRIDVASSGGVVTLTGTARSRDEEQRAVTLARGVDGVRDVRSELKVQ